MSRFKRFIHGVVSGYAGLAAATVYSLASVPLALHYLTKEQFGLWALMSTIGGYLSLLDFGMSGSVARLLIDHKDDRQSGTYGSLIKTGALVTTTQGAIVFLTGFAIAPILANLLKINPELQMDFIVLLRWQVAGLGLTFAMRIFSHILTAHQRMDIPNYSQIGAMAVNFSVQWWFFHAGQGVFSLAWGFIGGMLFNAGVSFIGCCTLPVLPAKGGWGRASWKYFEELFAYSKDFFLTTLGFQLIMASQTMIITRRLGLETAAVWAVGTRAFTMLYQLVSRILAISMPALSEMIVRGERANLAARFKDVVIVSASFAGFTAVGLAACNHTFVHILSHGKISWAAHNDVLLGIWLILLSILGCHNNLVLATKHTKVIRYVYFVEGIVFVSAAWFASHFGGLAAVITCSIVCSLCFSFTYGIMTSSRYFQIPVRQLLIGWLSPMYRVVCFTAPVALLAWIATRSLDFHHTADTVNQMNNGLGNDYLRFAIMAGICGTVGLLAFVFQGLPSALRSELVARSPKPVSGIFQRLLNFR